MIPFNIPPYTGEEQKYIEQAIKGQKICGDGPFTKESSLLLEKMTGCPKVLLTTSCTSALEMAVRLCGVGEGDEVILPSYTFSSTANSVVMAGAVPVFVDIDPGTMNIDETKIEDAITSRTRAIIVVHYAGVSCEMDKISDTAKRHGLKVIEDAAQGVMSRYKGRYLGTIGDFGCFSFHETKNYSMGEGGALLINDPSKTEEAEILREKGTDRSKFFRGQVDKYSWVDKGSSYLPSDILAAYLLCQLKNERRIYNDRMRAWDFYKGALSDLVSSGKIDIQKIPEYCEHNAHMFYIKAKDLEERTRLICYLKENRISAPFHYVPLHSSPAGVRYGRFNGEDIYTTRESERILRLPLYYNISDADLKFVAEKVIEFYDK